MTDKWGIDGNWPYFTVEPARVERGIYGSAAINGTYDSRLDALEHLISSLEETRRQLGGEITKHKRALRRAKAMEARRAETQSGSVHDSAVPERDLPK